MAALFLAGAACSGGDDGDVTATESTRRTTTTVDESTTSSSESTTSTAAGQTTTTPRPGSTAKPPTSGTPGATAAPVDKPALQRMATLNVPIAMATRPNDGAIYIAEKGGTIRRLAVNATSAGVVGTALDITDEVSTGSEQGLLGFDFSPDGNKLYASYTNTDGDTRIVEYPFANSVANEAGRRVVLAVDQPYANHNGGNIVFGPDNMLYIGLGDGGSGGDPENRAQDLSTLLGKMLRINPAQNGSAAYSIPAGNPYIGQSGRRAEIWHYGLRNPWRFSFDAANGEQWIADVGQNAWEEVNHIEAGRKGANFGWRLREGNHAYAGGSRPAGNVDPVYELSHDDGNNSITGGYVYRGSAIRGVAGTYLFADVGKGRLLGLTGSTNPTVRDLGIPMRGIISFGEDASNEIWLLTFSGGVYKLVRA
ncbi:MAG: PQQ-dependent sugar dehydrogenase [Acidimicrobiales bacterium]|nr:PQQ-dependent sugar dehydrogenase [Acidimicrobiales bacterium]